MFTALDALWVNWQKSINYEDKEKIMFTFIFGSYIYTRMPFGIRNAPATFQRAFDSILFGVWWMTCLVYVVGVVSFSKICLQLVKDIKKILTLLHLNEVTLELPHRQIFQKKTKSLVHIVFSDRKKAA